MNPRLCWAGQAALMIALLAGASPFLGEPVPKDSLTEFRRNLTVLGTATPDPCMVSPVDDPVASDVRFAEAERQAITWAGNFVLQELNTGETGKAHERITSALRQLEQVSAEVNGEWPEDNRFHAKVLKVASMLVVTMNLRTEAHFEAFAVPLHTTMGEAANWMEVGSEELSFQHPAPRSWINVVPLHPGPSGRARFLASEGYTGCAGSSGVQYEAYEWSAEGMVLKQIVNVDGAQGMDPDPAGTRVSKKHPFPPAGPLQLNGTRISLPYCWFSAIDYWDNPSLCAVETYDLSGDEVRFVSRRYNRPELVPIAKALEHAAKHEFPEVRAYCATDAAARAFLRGAGEVDRAEDPAVRWLGQNRAVVTLGAEPTVRFAVGRRNGRWLVTSVSAE